MNTPLHDPTFERCAVFIDGGYVDQIMVRHLKKRRLDYIKFPQMMAQQKDVRGIYYYHCLPHLSHPPTPEENDRFIKKDRLFQRFGHLPNFKVKLGKLAKRYDANGQERYMQKQVDILLSLDLVEMAATHQIDRAILVAGDSDFIPAINAARRHGVLVTLWHGPRCAGPNNTCHQDLWRACDEAYEIDDAVAEACSLPVPPVFVKSNEPKPAPAVMDEPPRPWRGPSP